MTGRNPGRTTSGRIIAAVSLAALVGVMYAAVHGARSTEGHGDAAVVAALGFLLLGGALAGEIVDIVRLPHLTGYIAVGVVAGPHILSLIDAVTVKRLAPVNTLALSLIALAGGAELRFEQVRRGIRSLAVATVIQSLAVAVVVGAVFLLARPLVPFARELTTGGLIAVAILWGVVATSRSPSATLGILAQTRAKGSLTNFALGFVMSSDVVVILFLAVAMMIARPLLEPGTTLSVDALRGLGYEIVGSVAIGTTLGLLLALYLKLVGKQLLIVLVALGFGASEVLDYLRFDPLLTFVVAGFVVQNLSKQGDKFLHAIEETGGVVYVLFFASAGADLDIPLLRTLWPLAVILAGVRGVVTFGAARLSSFAAKDEPILERWAWTALIAQAGLTQGLAGLVEHDYPTWGGQFRALVIANVALNAVVGPVLFKLALDRTGESKGPAPSLSEAEPA